MAASNNHRLTVTVKPNSGHTLFRYTAKDIDGKVVRGTMEAADYDTLRGCICRVRPAAVRAASRAHCVRRS